MDTMVQMSDVMVLEQGSNMRPERDGMKLVCVVEFGVEWAGGRSVGSDLALST